jgi:arylsulfatase A-like enzyme
MKHLPESSITPSRRDVLKTAAACVLSGVTGANGQARLRPNILVILADDQGWGDLSINGNSNVSTPNIDSLARDGAIVDRFFVCPVCAPTRAEFLTGRYHSRGGVHGVDSGSERLNLDERTIADTFKAAGYSTGAFGKWHNGTQAPYHPNSRGFDEFYGFTSGHWPNYFNSEIDHNGTLVQGKGYLADDLTDHAMEFMSQTRSSPFFCYLPFNTPHSPMQVPDRFFEHFIDLEPKMRARNPKLEELPMTRAALAMTENLDWNVGRALAKLEELKIADNTIVLYFSDNGPNSWRWNGGMKGRKGSVDEGGVREPFLIRWTGHIPAGKRITQIAGAIDLLPTLSDMAGIPLIGRKPLDGKSIKPLLLQEPQNWPDRMIFTEQNGNSSVRTQQYRMLAAGQLYDMAADPMQDRDIAATKPEIALRLSKAILQWKNDVLPISGKDLRPFTVGYSKVTRLPARDGIPYGGIERSSKFPNSSYFTNWTMPDGRITWDIEVGRTGYYDADVFYTCAEEDLGSTIELSFLQSRVRALVTLAWDPPLLGAEQDRVPRIESYFKEFRPLRFAPIRLEKGRGPLTLQATSIKAKRVADIRYVSLTFREPNQSPL